MVTPPPKLEQFFPGDSEMARRMRAFDWTTTDLGSPERWPENLRTAVSLCLTSRFPILIWWGPNLSILYNDAYVPFLGETKHPRYLGGHGQEVWKEIWDPIGPMLESVFKTGQATWSDDFLFFFARRLPREEVYVTFTYGPILAADGRSVQGIFCPCTETTEKVVGARRLETLRKLGVGAMETRTIDDACEHAANVLAENPFDIPFAAIYLVNDGGTANLKSLTGFTEDAHPFPSVVLLSHDDHSTWPLARVLRERRTIETSDLVSAGLHLPGGCWPEPSTKALVLPVFGAQHESLSALAVVGVGPRRVLDDAYRTFLALIAGHIGTAISDARAYQAEQKRAETLAELDRTKTAFFSNVSHEFRTPLTLMLGPIEDMLSGVNGSITIERDELNLVHRNMRRLLKLVNTLLDFSRIEANRVQAFYEPVNLATFTTDLASVFRSAIERAGLRLVIDCPSLGQLVYVDRGMWEQIVLNLLSNALKFTFEGEIQVSLRQREDHAELTIRDTGTGIPESEMPRLFERFHRVEGARGRTFEGSGIGLALVQELAKLHGGTVRAESDYGRGSQFVVSIPLGRAHLPIAQTTDEVKQSSLTMTASVFVDEALRWFPSDEVGDPRPGARDSGDLPANPTTFAGPRPTILFADDNADLRDYVRRLLSDYYTVETVTDGEAALLAASEELPDLLLADVMMPRLDGFGLLKAWRAQTRTRNIPVILLSARAGEESRVEGLTAGADDYLVKPFSARELLARVSARLEITRLHRQALEREQKLRLAAQNAEQALKQARDELEQNVHQRTSQLSVINTELIKEIADRERAEVELTRVKDELAADLKTMIGLHELSTRLLATTQLQPLLEEILDAAIELLDADFGNIQLRDPDSRTLRIVAHRGFNQHFLDHFSKVDDEGASCGRAMLQEKRVIVEDVNTDPGFEPHRHIIALAGFRAVQSTPLFNRDGEPLGMISTHFRLPHRPSDHDLRFLDLYAHLAAEFIERRHASEALSASENRFRRYFELGLIGMAITSPSKGILEVNDELCRILGYERKELLKMTWADMTHPEDLAADVEQFNRVLSSENDGYTLDKRWICKDGRIIHSIMSAKGVRGPDGSVDYLVGLVLDTTERKEADAALRRSEQNLADGQRLSHTGSWRWNVATGECFWSLEHYRIFGLDPETFNPTMENTHRLIHPEDLPYLQEVLDQALREKSDFQVEYRLIRPDGTIRYHRSVGHPEVQESGELEFIGSVMDLTERRLAEDELRKAQAELAHVSRVTTLGELTASIAHEVNQPLGAIVTNGQACLRLLSCARPDLTTARECVDSIITDAVRASEVIKRIRAMLKKSTGGKSSHRINNTIRDVLDFTAAERGKNKISLTTELSKGLPLVIADRVQIQQVVLNLVLNSIEAMSEHEWQPRNLLIKTEQSRVNEVLITISDSGVGIEPQDRERIFEPFFTSKEGGLGLGLSISRTIIAAHGGRLWTAPNKSGPGTTFSFTLPAN